MHPDADPDTAILDNKVVGDEGRAMDQNTSSPICINPESVGLQNNSPYNSPKD